MSRIEAVTYYHPGHDDTFVVTSPKAETALHDAWGVLDVSYLAMIDAYVGVEGRGRFGIKQRLGRRSIEAVTKYEQHPHLASNLAQKITAAAHPEHSEASYLTLRRSSTNQLIHGFAKVALEVASGDESRRYHGEISELDVDPMYQGQGIGLTLMHAGLRHVIQASPSEYPSVKLDVVEGANSPAREWYERIGFSPTGWCPEVALFPRGPKLAWTEMDARASAVVATLEEKHPWLGSATTSEKG